MVLHICTCWLDKAHWYKFGSYVNESYIKVLRWCFCVSIIVDVSILW